MVREVRAAIGDRPLRLDANHAWTVPTAREVLRRLAPYDIRCIEEPVGSHEELARLRPFTDIAFSAHAPDLRRAVALGVPDFYVLNIVELGGIRRTVEFVRACELFGIGFWFHSGDTGVASAAYLQLSAALEPIREPSQALFHWYGDDVIAEGPFCPRRGVLPVPDGPGTRRHARCRGARALPRALPRRGRVPVGRAGHAGAHAGLVRRAQAQPDRPVRFPLVSLACCSRGDRARSTGTGPSRAATSRFDGWIYLGVTSTGVYCRPSCPAALAEARQHALLPQLRRRAARGLPGLQALPARTPRPARPSGTRAPTSSRARCA